MSGSFVSVRMLQFKYSGKPKPKTSKKKPQRLVVSENKRLLIVRTKGQLSKHLYIYPNKAICKVPQQDL